ncbi:MAG: PIG-L family deacetylase [Bryobacterales bacterium]
MPRTSIALALLFVALAASAPAQDRATILAVFAHPDDETTVAGAALAKYAEGHDVYLATITSAAGNANTDIPAAPSSAKISRSRKPLLGRRPRHPRALSARLPGRGHHTCRHPERHRRTAHRGLRASPARHRHHLGPDGLTGHPDHRVASNLTTQIFQSADKLQANPRKLYYVAMPSKLMPPDLRGVDDRYITTKIDANAYAKQSAASVRCHKTQWDAEHMDEMIRMGCDLLGGIVHLRLALDAGSNAPTETSIE